MYNFENKRPMKYIFFSSLIALFMLAACGNEQKEIQKEINEGEEQMQKDSEWAKQRVSESEDFFNDTTINYDSIVNDPNRKKY